MSPQVPICGDQDSSYTNNCADFIQMSNMQTFFIPGTGPVSVVFDFVLRDAAYSSELCCFETDNELGHINGMQPGQPGYLNAALERARVIFPSGSDAYTPDVTLTFNGGIWIAFLFIQGNNLINLKMYNPGNYPWLSPIAFFSITSLNPDGIQHMLAFKHRLYEAFQLAFEDTAGGGDSDFNDSVYNFVLADQPPAINCPDDISVSSDPGEYGAVVTYTAPAASDYWGIASVEHSLRFPVGTTTITVTATDTSGNQSASSFNVTVLDTEPPQITCPEDITIENDLCRYGAVVVFPPPVVYDNCGIESVVFNPESGSVFPVGTTTVTCTATDIHGNSSVCSFFVTVNARPLQEQIQNLIDQIEDLHDSGVLNKGQSNSLITKLNHAIDSLNNNRNKTASNQLQSFINEVGSLVGDGILTPEQGDLLINCATVIRNQIVVNKKK